MMLKREWSNYSGFTTTSLAGIAGAPLATPAGAAHTEVGIIERGEQASSGNLAGDGGQSVELILSWIRHAASNAAIRISNQHPPASIDGAVIEIEQVAALVASPAVPDATRRNRTIGCCADGRPASPAFAGKWYAECTAPR